VEGLYVKLHFPYVRSEKKISLLSVKEEEHFLSQNQTLDPHLSSSSTQKSLPHSLSPPSRSQEGAAATARHQRAAAHSRAHSRAGPRGGGAGRAGGVPGRAWAWLGGGSWLTREVKGNPDLKVVLQGKSKP